uniref:Uncharacterized protein n=1 Tax=Arundo donax TaxID=35708 RepID=A0A0A9FI98_ARUDO
MPPKICTHQIQNNYKENMDLFFEKEKKVTIKREKKPSPVSVSFGATQPSWLLLSQGYAN